MKFLDYNKVTNRGEMFKVMATVTQITKDVLKEMNGKIIFSREFLLLLEQD